MRQPGKTLLSGRGGQSRDARLVWPPPLAGVSVAESPGEGVRERKPAPHEAALPRLRGARLILAPMVFPWSSG